VIEPDPASVAVYNELYPAWRKLYFGLGQKSAEPVSIGDVLPLLRRVAAEAHSKAHAA
jgi:L-ribulokinase